MHAIYAAGTERRPSIEVDGPRRQKGDFFSPSQPTPQPENLSQTVQPPVPSESHEMNVTITVFTADVDVRVDAKLSAELLRSTKKNPRSRLKYSLIYVGVSLYCIRPQRLINSRVKTGKDEYDQSLADEKNQPTARSIFRGLRADLNGLVVLLLILIISTYLTQGRRIHESSLFVPTSLFSTSCSSLF
jgi:hypothetical protein